MTSAPTAAVIAVLLPAAFLGLLLALGRYEEHLFNARRARHRSLRAGRHVRPSGKSKPPGTDTTSAR